jgi:dihydrofolate reductase
MLNLDLPDRTLVRITKTPVATIDPIIQAPMNELEMNLEDFWKQYPDGWLIGGQTMLLSAIEQGYVDRVLVSHTHAKLGQGIQDEVTPLVYRLGWYSQYFPSKDLTLVTWKRP